MGPSQSDGKRVISGIITRVNGATVSNVVRLDANGALDAPFSQNLGTVNTPIFRIKGLPSGQYLLCSFGADITAGGLTRTDILRLNANGTADASFDAGAGSWANGGYNNEFTLQPDGKLLVGGSFATFGTTAAAGVVRLNPNGSVDTGFSVGTGLDFNNGENVYAMAVQANGRVVVGGDFANFNGQLANGLTRLNSTGSLDASFVSPLQVGSYVENVVMQPDGNILVSGNLRLAGATAAALVRLLPSGALDPAFSLAGVSPSNGNFVTTGFYDPAVVLQPDGRILVAGHFTTATTTALRVARLNANGTLDNTFQATSGPSSTPRTIGLEANGTVLVGGSFNNFGGTETGLGRLTTTGATDPAYRPSLQIPGSVSAVVRQPDGKLIAGGNFTEINGTPVHRLARFGANGSFEAAYSSATGLLPGTVTKLLLQPDGKLLVGNTGNTLRLDANGSPDPSFTPFSAATALALQPDGKVLIGGNFSGYVGSTSVYENLVRVTDTGTYDPSFNRPTTAASGPGVPSYTDAILVQPDGRIVVGGNYTDSSGRNQGGHVTRYETDGRLDPTFSYTSAFTTSSTSVNASNRLYTLALQPDGAILVGGNFATVGGTARPGVARLTAAGTLDASFAPNRVQTGTVFALALQPNGRVLLGGSFSSPTPTPSYTRMARVLANGQFDASFAPTANPNGTVRALLVQPDGAIVLAGSFTTVGGQVAVALARITAPNVLAVAAPAAVAARTAAWPVPAHGLLHVLPDFSARPLSIELLDALGRPLQSQPAASATETTLDLSQRAAGVYLLRVQYAAGAVVRRVVVE